VEMEGKRLTLLVAPMAGFYDLPLKKNPGRTQMRIAYVETPERMKMVPGLFKELLQGFLKRLEQIRPTSVQTHR
jgi:aspartate aminotransferase